MHHIVTYPCNNMTEAQDKDNINPPGVVVVEDVVSSFSSSASKDEEEKEEETHANLPKYSMYLCKHPNPDSNGKVAQGTPWTRMNHSPIFTGPFSGTVPSIVVSSRPAN